MDKPQPEPTGVLPSEAAVRLRRLFQLLRIEHRTKYKALAASLQIDTDLIYRITSGRSSGSYELLRSVENYMFERGISTDNGSESDDQYGLDYFLDALDITQEIIANSVQYAAGKYLLFSFLSNKKIAVTWVEMFEASKRMVVPFFRAKRVGSDSRAINYNGIYYEYMSSLFMFGHISDTPLARSIVLVPVGRANSHDRRGVMTGASYGDSLFSSACYMHRLGETETYNENEHWVGEHDPDNLQDKFKDAVNDILSRQNLCEAVLRGGG